MAQGLVGVGGVPRNIAEIKVGVGGVRTVTEAYVGVGGAPRLCWSGNKWANKLYLSFSVWVNEMNCVNLYQIDTNSFASTFVKQFVGAYSAKTGGGFKQLYRMGWSYESFQVLDFNSWATVVSLGKLPNDPYSNAERKGAYLYYRHYRNNRVEMLDANTYVTIGTVYIGVETGIPTSHLGTNSTGVYVRGYPNGSSTDGIYRVDGIPDAPIASLVYPTTSAKLGWNFAVTDSNLFESEIGNAEHVAIKKIDINTGSVIQTGTTKADAKSSNNIFSPKKIK